VTLSRHLGGVRDFARGFARALALAEDVVVDVELAGWLHDIGKADPRFQLMLHGADPVAEAVAEEPLAKSKVTLRGRAARERVRSRAGYPRGARHELMSVALVEHSAAIRARAKDWDLVLHLVASHHGYCRPFAPPVLDPDPRDVTVAFDGLRLEARSDHRLARIDSLVTERFWTLVERYGFWGLAWLEAIVRLADHRESEKEAKDG
jgi:CRISPR-associated endonuclease/helicase Cas3